MTTFCRSWMIPLVSSLSSLSVSSNLFMVATFGFGFVPVRWTPLFMNDYAYWWKRVGLANTDAKEKRENSGDQKSKPKHFEIERKEITDDKGKVVDTQLIIVITSRVLRVRWPWIAPLAARNLALTLHHIFRITYVVRLLLKSCMNSNQDWRLTNYSYVWIN